MQRYSSGPYTFKNDDLSITNSILMEMPLFKNLFSQNQELEEHVQMLKYNIMYFESTNKKLMKKVDKLKRKIKSHKKKLLKQTNNINIVKDKYVVKTEVMEINELEIDEFETDEFEIDELKIEVETEEIETEEIVETDKIETEEIETEEIVETDKIETEEIETEEIETEEIETEEIETVETEEVETEETEEVEEDVYEIEINGKIYYVSNEKDSVIYAADENGDISIEAGVYKNGNPTFN